MVRLLDQLFVELISSPHIRGFCSDALYKLVIDVDKRSPWQGLFRQLFGYGVMTRVSQLVN